MKAVTGNRLDDGAVVYLRDDDQWTPHISEALHFRDEDAAAKLALAQTHVLEIAIAYLIDLDDGGAPGGRERLRETIRKSGPTVRKDLGYQASA